MLAAIRCHKADIVSLLTTPDGNWMAEDWQTLERAGIAEFDGGRSRTEAEAFALEGSIVEWLNRHPEDSDPDHCAW